MENELKQSIKRPKLVLLSCIKTLYNFVDMNILGIPSNIVHILISGFVDVQYYISITIKHMFLSCINNGDTDRQAE